MQAQQRGERIISVAAHYGSEAQLLGHIVIVEEQQGGDPRD